MPPILEGGYSLLEWLPRERVLTIRERQTPTPLESHELLFDDPQILRG